MLSPRNVVNILNQSSYLLLFAAAQMVVILTRGFDLSLGTTVSAVSVASALAMTGLADGGAPDWVVVAAGLAAGLGFGALVGLFNGIFVAWLEINPFVVTLGSLNICLGLATTISGGAPGLQRARRFQQPALQRRVDPRDFDSVDAGGDGLRRCCISCSTTRCSADRSISSATTRARRIWRGPAEQALPDSRLYHLLAVGRASAR